MATIASIVINDVRRHYLAPATIVEEIHRHGGPYQGYDALGYHSTVEDGAALALVLHAASHQGALRSMKAANGTTGNGEEQAGEDGVLGHKAVGAQPSGVGV